MLSPRRQCNVFERAHVGKQVERLEHDANALSQRLGIEAWLGDIDSVEQDTAVVDRFEQVNTAKYC